MPPPRSDFERELQMLEVELKRLEAEYNMFFAGRLPRLPWTQRTKVDTLMKRFGRLHLQNTGDRFRFQTLQSRWASFTELWERQLKAQESGRRPGRPHVPAAASAPEPSLPPLPQDKVVAVAQLSDPGSQPERVRALYDRLADARRAAGEKPIEYEPFAELVRAQVKKLGAEGRDVTFRVVLKEGRVTLAADVGEDS